jgi:hypothetical protein
MRKRHLPVIAKRTIDDPAKEPDMLKAATLSLAIALGAILSDDIPLFSPENTIATPEMLMAMSAPVAPQENTKLPTERLTRIAAETID